VLLPCDVSLPVELSWEPCPDEEDDEEDVEEDDDEWLPLPEPWLTPCPCSPSVSDLWSVVWSLAWRCEVVLAVVSPEEPDVPEEPDDPDEPECDPCPEEPPE
jgi:hypothetical protein